MLNITPRKGEIMIALGRFKFLTISQMARLELSNDRGNTNRLLGQMRKGKHPLIGSQHFASDTLGKRESMHFLTKYGAKLLEEGSFDGQVRKVRYPIGTGSLFSKDYLHRRQTIDFQIALWKWCNLTQTRLVFFQTYFDKQGNPRKGQPLQSIVRITVDGETTLIPDAVFKLTRGDEERLVFFEMHNGKDAKRLICQLENYVDAIEHINQLYRVSSPIRVLCLFNEKGCMEAVKRRLTDHATSGLFTYTHKHFFFREHASLLEDGDVDAFHWANGERFPFFA